MRFCFPLTATDAALNSDDVLGGKARSLLRLRDAGLPVPPAFVIGGALFRALRQGGPPLPARLGDAADLHALEAARAALLAASFPEGFDAELSAALATTEATTIGEAATRWAVRSSFASEDQPGALAAGLFQSVTNVERPAIAAAIHTVLASALAPAALQYALRRKQSVDELGMPVLIHPFTEGAGAGSAAWDPAVMRVPVIDSAGGTGQGLSAKARASIDDAVRRLTTLHGPVEIEWVATDDTVVYLQLRPFQAPTPAPAWAGHAQPSGDWRWDASHNPLPVSPAQAALVRLVDQRCELPFRQAVAGGYLFYAPDAPDDDRAPAGPTGQRLPSIRAQHEAVAAAVARDLAALGPTPTLAAALETFVTSYQRIFGQLQPAAQKARAALEIFLKDQRAGDATVMAELLADVPSFASQRRAAAARIRRATADHERATAVSDYLRDFGDETPIWDVAIPTFSEDPRLLPQAGGPDGGEPPADAHPRWRTAADQLRDRLPEPARAGFDALLGNARDAVAAGELDDHLYARLQASVRRALRAEGARLTAGGVLESPDDIFWLSAPLPARHDRNAGTADPPPLTRAQASAQLQQAHAADQDARRAPPPRAPSVDAAGDSAFIRGKPGAGGRAVGRAFIYPDPNGAVPDSSAVVVATTLLPTELPLLDAAALVVETGGILGHVAAQARERHLPAVVGATSACTRISSGDQLLVDGDAGWVLKL